jgi:hypothetical protein
MWHELGENRNAYRVSIRRPYGMRALGRPMHRLRINISMEFK